MSLQIDLAKPSPVAGEKASFRDVVAYLHGVTDAVHTMQTSARSGWPLAAEANLSARAMRGDSSAPSVEARKSARLTLRYGEAEIELEGVLVFSRTAAPFRALPARGGARLVDLEGMADGDDDGAARARGTLPYWSPAVSLVPLRPFAGDTERPFDLNEQIVSLPYSALALSLVPIAPVIPSGWPEEGGEERVSAIRLRSAPLSAEFYALTGTDDWTF